MHAAAAAGAAPLSVEIWNVNMSSLLSELNLIKLLEYHLQVPEEVFTFCP